MVGEYPTRLSSGRLRYSRTLNADDDDLVGTVETLSHGLSDAQASKLTARGKEALASVGNGSRSVVACRARKDQQAQMLKLIKERVPSSCCLANGDSAGATSVTNGCALNADGAAAWVGEGALSRQLSRFGRADDMRAFGLLLLEACVLPCAQRSAAHSTLRNKEGPQECGAQRR